MRLQWIHHAWNPQMHIKILSVAFLFCSYSTVLVIWQVFNNYFQLSVQLLTAVSLQSCPTLCDSIDSSPPGSPVPGILQARTLEWVAISFSTACKWKVKVKSLSCVRLFATPWTAAYQAPPPVGFSRQEYCSGVPSPSPISSTTFTKYLLYVMYYDEHTHTCAFVYTNTHAYMYTLTRVHISVH